GKRMSPEDSSSVLVKREGIAMSRSSRRGVSAATSLDDSRLSRPGRARFGKPFGGLVSGSGDDNGPAGGPGGRGSTGPGCSFLWRWGGLALVRGLAAGR